MTAGRRYREAGFAGLALFVNVNPDTLATDPPEEIIDVYEALMQERPVVLEITERAVLREPGRLMDAVLDARRRTARIAVDDVGADPASLAALPLINPDIIKVDRSIIQSRSSSWAVSQVMNAVLNEAQRRNAQILAEGIETAEHLEVARSMGATLGQGWLFGRPGPLPRHVEPSTQALARVSPRDTARATPFEVLAETEQVHATPADSLTTMSAHIESQAAQTVNPAILVVNLGDGDLDDGARIRYNRLAGRGINVFIIGKGLAPQPGGRIRAIPLDAGDPLVQERTILFVGSRDACGVFGRRRTAEPSSESYDVGTCHNAEQVIEATLTLVNRLQRQPIGNRSQQ